MRLLADENFPKAILDFLRDAGHDVMWARTDRAGSKDPELLNLAEEEARIVLTLDKDFWQIALQRRLPLIQAGVVLFRIHPATTERIEPLVRAFLAASMDWQRHISNCDGRWNPDGAIPTLLRNRPLPLAFLSVVPPTLMRTDVLLIRRGPGFDRPT